MAFSSRSSRASVQRLRSLLARKRWEEAEREIESALRFHPEDVELLSLAADLCRRTSRPREARAYLDRARGSDPAHPAVRAVAADLAFQDGRYEEAARAYQELLDRRPDRWLASRLVLALNRLGEYQRARDAARSALELFRDDPWLLRGLAQAESRLDHREEAARVYEKILELEPEDRLAYKMLIELRTASFSAEEAASALGGLMKTGDRGKNPHLRTLAADRLREAGRDEEAIAEYEAALSLDPANAYARAQIGFCHKRLGRPEQAASHLAKAFLANPADLYVRRTLESLLGRANQLPRMIELVEEALKLHPGAKSLYGVRQRLAKRLTS